MFEIKQQTGALFQLTVRKAATDEIVRQTPQFKNLVLDQGLAQMGGGDNQYWGQYVAVGTGNSPPTTSQMKLDNLLWATSTLVDFASASNNKTLPVYLAATRTFRFPTGKVVGNLTEVGLCWFTGGSVSTIAEYREKHRCWNRALIKDINGDPTVLTILDDEYLDVTVEIRVYPAPYIEGSFNFLDRLGNIRDTFNYQGRPFIGNGGDGSSAVRLRNVGLYTGAVLELDRYDTVFKSGYRALYGSPNTQTYSTDQLSLTATYNVGLSSINDMPINGIELSVTHLSYSSDLHYAILLDKSITKTNQQELQWTFTYSWSRYEGD